MPRINQEMICRQRMCEYARSLALRSRRPHHSPTAHTGKELELIRNRMRRNGIYGMAAVYVRCLSQGYTRSFESMCRQIRKNGYRKPEIHRKSYTRYEGKDGKFPGDKVQVDIKYVPEECIRFPTYGDRYYQITAIDEYSRKRALTIVKEKSTYETAKFLKTLPGRMGLRIHQIQVDNGSEFVHDPDKTDKETAFELAAKELEMMIHHTRPYSPWQNGKVERSHREDGKILYGRKAFTSEKELVRQVEKHERRYNSTAKTVLKFRSLNQVVPDYFSISNV